MLFNRRIDDKKGKLREFILLKKFYGVFMELKLINTYL